jgi:putative transposase
MKSRKGLYRRHRFPPEIIQHSVRLYYRFNLSHRDIEDLLARRGVLVSHESIRLWCNKFGPHYAHRLRRRHRGFGDTFFTDEVFVTIAERQHYLWRAVDQDGDVVNVYLPARSNAEAAKRPSRRLIRSHGTTPRKIVTDKLGSYGVACGALMPETIHSNDRYANNRAELSHQPTRARERGMRRFSSPDQAQRFLSAHAVVYSLFNLQRHLASVALYRLHRARAFKRWSEAVAA